MNALPPTKDALVLRTDFADDRACESICAEIRQPVDDFRAYVECVSNSAFDSAMVGHLVALAANGPYRSFIFVVDRVTVTDPQHPILVVDLVDTPGRTFRVVPREMWSVENNLSLANMDFAEFAESVDADGIFRGFPTV